MWVDSAHYLLASQAGSQTPVVINTNLVKPEEIQSYNDLLAPKWKGKIIQADPTVSGFGQSWICIAGALFLGWDYMRQLAMQEPFLTRDNRLQIEWLARGKYSIAIGAESALVAEFIKVGAPIALRPPKGASSISVAMSTLGLVNRAPHPNAARLFINWVLTKEPQTIWSQQQLYPSLRLDVPTSHIEPDRLLYREPGVKLVKSHDEEYLLHVKDEARKKAIEIFGPLTK